MPAPEDIFRFFRGQLFQTPQLPNKSFAGKTVVVTGANTGLGFDCAKHLVNLNVSILVLACRSLSKGEEAKKQILAATKRNDTTIHVWEVDMATFASAKRLVERMTKELPRLDGLIANAGISTNEYHTAEGFERTLTVNVISTFLLALLALPQLQQTATKLGHPTNLTVVGSNVHCFANASQLQKCPQGQVFSTLSDQSQADMAARYFLSKLMVMQSIRQLAKEVPKLGKDPKLPSVIVNCPSPGWCKTELFRQDDGGFFGRNMLRLIGRTSEMGSRTLVSAIVAGEETHGQYVSECQTKPASVFVRSEEGENLQVQVWQELVGILKEVSPGVGDVLVKSKHGMYLG